MLIIINVLPDLKKKRKKTESSKFTNNNHNFLLCFIESDFMKLLILLQLVIYLKYLKYF